MDRHDAPGVTPEELADLHMRDLEVEERHRVRYHTYWFDPTNGSVFCLAEGPTKQALEAVHQEAHGQLAGTIVDLDPNVPLNKLLGAQPEYPAGTPYAAPAMRAIVFTRPLWLGRADIPARRRRASCAVTSSQRDRSGGPQCP
jgi:hypothetical protein